MVDITKIGAFVQNSPYPAWLATSKGDCVYANPALERLTGLSLEEILQADWRTFLLEEDLAAATASWQGSLATGTPYRVRVRMRGIDGIATAVDLIALGHGTDDGAELWLFVGSHVDAATHQSPSLEVQLKATLNVIPAYIWYALPSGALTFVNERNANYLGLPKDHPLRFGIDTGGEWDSHIPLLHPDDREESRRVWSSCLSTGTAGEFSFRVRSAEGEYRWFLSRAEPLRANDGALLFWIGVNLDIDDAKRAEVDLQRTQFYLSEGQRLARMGSWAFNPSGFFEYWSQELFKIYGLDPQKGAPTLEEYLATLHPQDQESMAETIKTMRAERCGCDVKKRIVRPDGELRYVRCVGIPVAEGEVLKGFLGTAMDVTEQELLTQELERQQAYLTEAQRLTHTGSWAWNVSDRTTVHVSEEWYRIFGFDPAGGASTWEKRLARVHPDDRLLWKSAVERAIVEKADFDVIFRIVLPEGMVRWIHTVGHPVRTAAGELVQFVGSSTDVTERKSAEQEHEKLRQLEADLAHIDRVSTLGEMAASLAHEIKQPIAAAITSANSCIEWLSHDPPNIERARATATRIDRYGRRAAEIIDRIRSFYKKSHSERELVDVNGIINEMLALLQGEATRFSVEMHRELTTELPKIVADRIQLQQVFMNLMLNAIEAMSDSGGEVTVRSQVQDGQLFFSVTDTGPGLPAGSADQIFSAFFTTKPQGSGMGLAISRTIVESHSGRLWATANDGRGTTFQFTLPTELQ
jgi:PAS domain S-box-containing protein